MWEDFFRPRTRDEWCAFLERSDACVAPVLSLEEAPTHPHLGARAAYLPVGGDHGPELPVPAPRFSATPTQTRPSPARGAHTDELLAEVGYHPARIATLRSTSVVA